MDPLKGTGVGSLIHIDARKIIHRAKILSTSPVWVPAPLTLAISTGKVVNIARTALPTAGQLSRAKCCISTSVTILLVFLFVI